MSASIGSCRAETASSESSRSAANTGCGPISTAGSRSHQSRRSSLPSTASALTAPRVLDAREAQWLVDARYGERHRHRRGVTRSADRQVRDHGLDEVRVVGHVENDADVAEVHAELAEDLARDA